MNIIQRILNESISIREKLVRDKVFQQAVIDAAHEVVNCFRNEGKVLLCGNGGSASDAQHIAAELSGRFQMERKPLFAEALHVNSSFMTAVANDYGFEAVYERMVEAAGASGDVLIAISTSGNSENVLRAVKKANALGMHTIALLGAQPGKIGEVAQLSIHAPSTYTARVQEVHITIGHAICEMVEHEMFGA